MAQLWRHRLLRPLSLPLLMLCPWAVQSQDLGVAASTGASTETTSAVPTMFMAPNPPGCASKFADICLHLTNIGVKITTETMVCSTHFGFHNPVLYSGDPRNFPLGHNEYTCAAQILGTMASVIAVISDTEAIMFNCFNINEACAQTATAAVKLLLAAMATLTQAVGFCEPEGADPPYYPDTDIPVQGWFCWTAVWSSISYLLNAAKYIDTAWATCAPPEPSPEPQPEPQPKPQMVQPGPGVVVTPAPGLGAAGTGGGAVAQNETLGVMSLETASMPQPFESAEGWGQLQQPAALQPYKIVAASERRLSSAAAYTGFLAAAPWDLKVA